MLLLLLHQRQQQHAQMQTYHAKWNEYLQTVCLLSLAKEICLNPPKSRYTHICGTPLPPLCLPLDETVTDDLLQIATRREQRSVDNFVTCEP